MEEVVLFVISFIIIYFVYSTFVIKRKKKYNPNKVPMEMKFLIQKYKLDMDKINYLELVDRVSLWTSILLQFMSGFFLLILFILIGYHIIGKYYQKKLGKKEK